MSNKSLAELQATLSDLRGKEAKLQGSIVEWSKDLEAKNNWLGEKILEGGDLIKLSNEITLLRTQVEASKSALAAVQLLIPKAEAELYTARKAAAGPRLEAIGAEQKKLQATMTKAMQEILSKVAGLGALTAQEQEIKREFGLSELEQGLSLPWNSNVDQVTDIQLLDGPSFKDQVFIRIYGNRIAPVAFFTKN